MNFLNLAVISAVVLAFVACDKSSKNSEPNSNTVDVTYLHNSSKEMMGLKVQSVSAAVEKGDEVESTDTSPQNEYTNTINLDEKYTRLQPAEYEPIFREKAKKWAKSGVFETGYRYLTRSLSIVLDENKATACVFTTDSDNVLIKDNGKSNVTVIDSTNTLYEVKLKDKCWNLNNSLIILKAETERNVEEEMEESLTDLRKDSSFYRVDGNTFVEKNTDGVFFYHFKEDGRIHMDGVFKLEGTWGVVSYIPLDDLSTEEIESKYNGKTMMISKQVNCDDISSTENGPKGDDTADLCFSSDGSTEDFLLEKYLKQGNLLN